MTGPMSTWRPDWLLRSILGWTAFTFILAWLPMVRGVMDGDTYAWGVTWWGFTVGGSGMGGWFWVLPAQVALGVTLLWLGWRGARPPLRWLLPAWHAALFSSCMVAVISDPDSFRFRGRTAGVDVSLTWVAPALTGVFLLASIGWAVRDARSGARHAVAPWSRVNTLWLGGLLALLPVQWALLHFGEPHGATDLAGVTLTILQWLLLGHVLKPRPASGRVSPRVVRARRTPRLTPARST